MFSVLLVAEVLQGIGPKKVAHGPKCGGLFEAVKLKHEDEISPRDVQILMMTAKYYFQPGKLMATHLSNIV